jgi:hypothetical protein
LLHLARAQTAANRDSLVESFERFCTHISPYLSEVALGILFDDSEITLLTVAIHEGTGAMSLSGSPLIWSSLNNFQV